MRALTWMLVLVAGAAPEPGSRAPVAPAAGGRTVAYVSSAGSRRIDVLTIDDTAGTAAVVQEAAVTGKVMPLAISPDQRHLYASLRSEPFSVSTFAIGPDGALAPSGTVPLAADMAYLSTDRSGRWLLAASYFADEISVNAIRRDGDVDAKPLAVIRTGKHAHCIATDLSNRFVFASNLGADVILQYRFDAATGRLTPNAPAAVHTQQGAGPRHFVFHPNGRFVFGVNELDATVNAYGLDASGVLTLLGSTSALPTGFRGKPWAADIHLTPDGRFLYVSERTSSTLAAFRVDLERGALTPVGHYETERQPRGFAVDPSGRWLVAAGELSGAVAIHEIDGASGALRLRSRTRVGQDPNWVEIVRLPRAVTR